MRITSHPLRGSAAAAAARNSAAFDPSVRVHLRFVEMDDIPFLGTISPGPSPAARRTWLHSYKAREAQGREFNFVVVENGQDRGLVRMHDFTEIGGAASFRWGDFVSPHPGLLATTALTIYSLGFDALGYARAHMAVLKSNPGLAAFHLGTGAELEFDDGTYTYFRFAAATYEQIRDEALQRRTAIMSERA